MAGPEEQDWRRAARRRFVVPLVLTVVGVLVAALTSGVGGEIVGWSIVAVAVTIAISLVFLEVGLSEDREREREARHRR